MANEPGTAQLTLQHNGNFFVVDNFPADKFDELKLFAQTLTQPAVVPNMIPQPPPSSSTQIVRCNSS
ncbi:unnamed protein product [Trifolium pratense]|uniref:Uncharacterized protein n=1 Tax=Trifolium pratense TaxID=57577 RepID=A0ACB0JIK5_TRIPR|nr:unnamed protein product [Trifolium pratense]